MNGNNINMNVVSWIAIIISIMIASVGIIFGSARTTSAEAIAITRSKLDVQEARITLLETRFERIDERLINIQKMMEKHLEK
jgi:Tfp pilus assembly protein PilN